MIRLATKEDSTFILEIYEHARQLMRSYGSPQWPSHYPSIQTVKSDMDKNALYVLELNSTILGVMSVFDYESTYEKIEGKWLSNKPYKVIHRIATHKDYYKKGVSHQMIEHVLGHMGKESIRIDTHELNAPMQKLLLKMGFTYCGIIILNQSEDNQRLAYQKDI